MHLESARGNETRQFLIDFGFTGQTLNNNLDHVDQTVAALVEINPDYRVLLSSTGTRFSFGS